MREGLSGKIIRKLDAVVQFEERCAMGCTGSTHYDARMLYLREISTNLSHSQLQERLRVPCVFQNTGWGGRKAYHRGNCGGNGTVTPPIFKGGGAR